MKNWYWSESRAGWVLRALTCNPIVAQKSAEQWQRTIKRPCQAIVYDNFCGETRYSVIAPRLAGEWQPGSISR